MSGSPDSRLTLSEDAEQQIFVKWLDRQGYKYTSIPNSTYTTSWLQKTKNTAMGLRAGFPDMVVIAGGKFMCVEMKRAVGGVISPRQKAWISALAAAGVPVAACKGAVEAIRFVEAVAGGKKWEAPKSRVLVMEDPINPF